MVRVFVSFFLLLLCITLSHAQLYKAKILLAERIVYNVHYGIFNAGEVVVSVDSQLVNIDNTICYQANVLARTKGVAGFFSNINDVWTSYIDTTTLLSRKFIRNQQENDYKLFETTEFDRETNQVYVSRRQDDQSFQIKTYKTIPLVQDIFSEYFGLRTDQGEKLNANDTIALHAFLEDTTFHFKVKYLNKDRLKTKLGKMKAYMFSPIVPKTNNSILSGENPILLWISADDKKIPLKIKVNTKYGDVEVDIEAYSGND